MKTDRELLELAARAAVLPMCEEWNCAADGDGILIGHGNGDLRLWNPLTDDGDALRLAVKLKLQVTPGTYGRDEAGVYSNVSGDTGVSVGNGRTMLEATRRAIVRAAAAIGESMRD